MSFIYSETTGLVSQVLQPRARTHLLQRSQVVRETVYILCPLTWGLLPLPSIYRSRKGKKTSESLLATTHQGERILGAGKAVKSHSLNACLGGEVNEMLSKLLSSNHGSTISACCLAQRRCSENHNCP